MTFLLNVLAWLWASAWVIAAIWFLAIVVVYVLFRGVLAYNARHYDNLRIRKKFQENYERYLDDLQARSLSRHGSATDQEIVMLSDFLTEREITRKSMN